MTTDSARNWPTFTVQLDNNKSVKVKAPSPQRALQRVEREIERRNSPRKVIRVL